MNINDLKRLSGLIQESESNRPHLTPTNDDYAVHERVEKLRNLPIEQALKLVWGWVKSDTINFSQFRYMFYNIYKDRGF